MRQFFGTDGVRGLVGDNPITAEFALKLGHAVGRVLKAKTTHSPTVLIGKDTRISGYMLESALEAGFVSAGVNVLLTGPLPTPGIAYLTRALRLDLGVVISASHNPYYDNGIKFFSAAGEKLPDSWEMLVEEYLGKEPSWAHSAELGKAKRVQDAAGRYIEFCKASVSKDFSLRDLKIVVDAAHGAAYHIAPAVFHELGAEIVEIGVSPNGVNINDGVGATSPELLLKTVLDTNADYGVALDGDADRLQMVDRFGVVYNGDQLLYALAVDRLNQDLATPGVVGTVMTNSGVEKSLKALGVSLVRAKVGDRYIIEELLKRNWTIGGEGSGHILVLDKHSTGDGIISALQVLQAVVRSGKSLSQILKPVIMQHQEMINVRVANKPSADLLKTIEIEKARVEATMSSGRILIRPSGTEPVIRVMAESESVDEAKAVAAQLAEFTRKTV